MAHVDWGSSIRQLVQASALLLFTSLFGTIGFVLIEGYTLVDAIYMTIITMSTVGFGTIRDLTTEGKIFSIFLIIISAGTFIYAITTITTFVVEGEIRQVFNLYQVNRKVAKLKNHIIICGLGRNGSEAAAELLRQGQPFVIVESNQAVIADFRQHHDVLIVKGDATQEDVLEEANIQAARGLVTALSTDAENVYITLTARGMNSRLYIVARASQEASISKLRRAGANRVIVPNMMGGRKMVNLITRPALVEFVDLISGTGPTNLHLEDIPCAPYPKLLGSTLAELHIRSHTGVLVLGLKRGDHPVELNPRASEPLRGEDRLFVLGTDEQHAAFRSRYLEA
ncbi:MAG: potassium channel protein [Bacteroidetes bacterium]|nr:MAG: potassium channel protein [Bacteroidota bacterium]